MDENREYMADWNHENKKNWKANRQRQQDMKDREKYFQDLEVKAFKNKLERELDYATKDMGLGVIDFEKNL